MHLMCMLTMVIEPIKKIEKKILKLEYWNKIHLKNQTLGESSDTGRKQNKSLVLRHSLKHLLM